MATGGASDGSEAQARYIAGTLDYLPFVPNPAYFGFMNPFGAGVTSEYQLELDAEMVRRRLYPLAPSRLSAIYAFGDYDTCREVSTRYNWPLTEVKPFRLAKHEDVRVTKVNMEIVSLARSAYEGDGFLEGEDLVALWRSYWSGVGSIEMELPYGEMRRQVSSGCIWEYLVEGIVAAIAS